VSRQRLREATGLLLGAWLAPLTALGSALRRSRLFHPRGITLAGVASPVPEPPALHEVGLRLAGPVLVRFSGGFWRERQWLDVLGCAIRFTGAEAASAAALPDDQDLLLATIRHPATTLLASLSTQIADYLANDYFGVSPFEVAPLGRVQIRCSPASRRPSAAPARLRDDRLRDELSERALLLSLQVRSKKLGPGYHSVAFIELGSEVAVDEQALRFDPFRAGRGLQPIGFVHHLRVASYAASRWARSLTG
jgi:hypothetical protein